MFISEKETVKKTTKITLIMLMALIIIILENVNSAVYFNQINLIL